MDVVPLGIDEQETIPRLKRKTWQIRAYAARLLVNVVIIVFLGSIVRWQ